MSVTLDLPANAVVAGILIGAFYAAVALGISIAFGILDVVNIAHPAFVILRSYAAYLLNSRYGIDPMAAGLATPLFYALGWCVY